MNFKIADAPVNIETVERFAGNGQPMDIFILTTTKQESVLDLKNDGATKERKRRIRVTVISATPRKKPGYTFVGTICDGLGRLGGARFIADVFIEGKQVNGSLATQHVKVYRGNKCY